MTAVEAVETSLRFVSDFCSGVLDLVYPPFCLVCKERGDHYLCPECAKQIVTIGSPCCRKCGMPGDPGAYLCTDCQVRQYEFEQARSVGVYEDPLRKAIHALKYNFHLVMADPLADLMVKAFPDTFLGRHTDVVIPIPIHHSRLLDRGFNQSEELALRFCKRVSIPLERKALIKRKKTRPQVDLPTDMRAANVEGAFEVTDANRVAGKRVLLVDDVLTTGSTVNEAAKALRAAGAMSVCAYTLARSI